MKAPWIADRRLYLDRKGRVVEAKDPARKTLLICEGQSMPHDQAEALGLLDSAAETAQEVGSAMTSPPEHKAIETPKARAKR